MSFRKLPIRTNGADDNDIQYPFGINITNSNSQYSVGINPGTVNQFLPNNIFQKININKTGLYYVKLVVTTNGQSLASVSWTIDQTVAIQQIPTASSLPARVEILIGLIKNGAIFRTIGLGSVVLTSSQMFITNKNPPAGPGELNYIPYYQWQVSNS